MERNYAMDFIKGVGLLLVATLHISIFSQNHWFANWFMNTSMRFVVPFFFLTSGYLLFKKLQVSENKEKVFSNYLRRIGSYYLVGFVVCYAFDYFVTMPIWKMPSVFFRGYVSGNFWSDFLYYGMCHSSGFHLWFLIAMFWAGVILFLTCRKELRHIKMLTIIAFFIHIIGLFGKTQAYSQFFEIPLYPREAVFFGLFYMSLGGLWAYEGINVKKYITTNNIGWAVVVFLGLQLAERSVLVLPLHLPFGEYWGEYFITTIPLTMLLFQYALDRGDKFKTNILTKIGQKSIGVYMLHAIGINIIYMLLERINPELISNPVVQIGHAIGSIVIAYLLYSCFLKLQGIVKKRNLSNDKIDMCTK